MKQKKKIKGVSNKNSGKKFRSSAFGIILAAAMSVTIGSATIETKTTEIGVVQDDGKENGVPVYKNEDMEELVGFVQQESVVAIESESRIFEESQNVKITSLDVNGAEIEGWIDRENIQESIKLSEDEMEEYNTTYEVTGTETVNVRNKPVLEDEHILTTFEKGCQCLGKDSPQTSNDNAFKWVEVIWIDGDNIQHGYIAEEYLKNVQLEEARIGEEKVVQTNTGIELNVRDQPGIKSGEIIHKIPDGHKVTVVGVERYDIDEHAWIKVMHKEKGKEPIFGYVSSEYLSPKEKKEKSEQMIVDTSDTTVDYLKLRESYSLESEILAEMKTGTVVTVIKGEEKTRDGHVWRKVEYTDPETRIIISGWAANGYLKTEKQFIEKQVDTSAHSGVELKVREEPSLDGKIKLRVANGQVIYVDEEDFKNPVQASNYSWVPVSIDGEEIDGYVAKEFLKNYKKEIQVDDEVEKNKEYVTVVDSVSSSKQVLGIDVCNNPDNLRKLLENGIPESSNYLGQSNKIHHVIIRLGASPYGKNAELGEPTKSTNPDEIVKMVKVCEEYGIPYGYYYYSTGINNKEALTEFKIIKNLKKTVEQKYKKSTGKKTSPDLPIFVDVENAESGNNRLMQKKEGETEAERMKRVTKAEALLINELANEYGRENVGLYTDSRSANIVFDADALLKYVDNPNLPVWVANAYSFRNVVNKETTRESTTKFVETMKDKGYNVIMQQRALETNGCDVSIMEESAYKDIMDIENEEQNKELGIDRE